MLLLDLGPKRNVARLWLLLTAIGLTPPAVALTLEDLQGDYVLKTLQIDPAGFLPVLADDDLAPFTGYCSATAQSLSFEYSAHHNPSDTTYEHLTTGRYQLLDDDDDASVPSDAVVSRVDGTIEQVKLRLVPTTDTLMVTGQVLDSFGQPDYDYRLEFSRVTTYYSDNQLKQAIEDIKPKVVIIPLLD